MIKPTMKRSTLFIIVIVAVILSIAFLSQLEERTGISPVGPGTITSTSTMSKSQPVSTVSSSSANRIPGLLAFGQSYNDLFLTPNAAMNYTISITPLDKKVSAVALSAVSPVSGLSVLFDPKEFTTKGEADAIQLRISVGATVTSPTIPIDIVATTNVGVTNQTFTFSLEKERVIVYPGSTEFAKPSILHVNVGQRVTWFDNVDIDDDGLGYVNIVLDDGSAASPTMTRFDLWSHTFDKPGTYTYHVMVLGFGSSTDTIVVG